MSNTEKGQEIAKQAGVAAKKAGKKIGAGLSKLSKKVAAGAKGFKEGLKDADDLPVESETEYVPDESGTVEEDEEIPTTKTETDYSLDD